MKKILVLLSLMLGVFFVAENNAQTKVIFAKGASSKTLTVTIPAGGARTFSIQVKKDQVINATVTGDINVSKTIEFPVISLNLANGVEDVDRSQDGEGYLSVLAGRNGNYIISVANSDKKRVRTFSLKISVTNDRDDFLGGEEVEQ